MEHSLPQYGSPTLTDEAVTRGTGPIAALTQPRRPTAERADGSFRPESEALGAPEISVVMPCLNEAETLQRCIEKAQDGIRAAASAGEVIVSDNGSTDGSREIARKLGARIVAVEERGYGSALRAGIEAARGRFVIIGDADDSYDFRDIPRFMAKLREGHDLVMGNRFRGGIDKGAMPWKHKWIGNPVLSAIGRLFFRSSPGDFHCGMRAFSRAAYSTMDLKTTGMEFASEMVIKATLRRLRVAEVPIVLHKDGRSRPPHLRSWRDGWRHLRFMLLFSPRWLFLIPGFLLLLGGLSAGLWLIPGPRPVGSVVLDIHTLLAAAFLALFGFQLVVLAVFTKMFAMVEGLHPPETSLRPFLPYSNLEIGLVIGLLLFVSGLAGLGWATWGWRSADFGALDPRVTMRQVIPAITLAMFGVQTMFASFFLSILGLKRV